MYLMIFILIKITNNIRNAPKKLRYVPCYIHIQTHDSIKNMK